MLRAPGEKLSHGDIVCHSHGKVICSSSLNCEDAYWMYGCSKRKYFHYMPSTENSTAGKAIDSTKIRRQADFRIVYGQLKLTWWGGDTCKVSKLKINCWDLKGLYGHPVHCLLVTSHLEMAYIVHLNMSVFCNAPCMKLFTNTFFLSNYHIETTT